MDLHLKEKVIVVTGGASGIGQSIAEGLVSEGAHVYVLDIKEPVPEKENESRNAGTLMYIQTDLRDKEACGRAVDQIVKKFDRIDGLVNNAGLNDGVSLEQGNADQFMSSLEKNVIHYHTMTNLVLPFLKNSRGTIVNICSKVAETGQGGTSAYAAANGVRFELTRQWAAAYRPSGIRVNAVVVAECWTPQYEWWISQQENPKGKLNEIVSRIPLGNRMTATEEVASTVIFLLSEKSSAFNSEFFHVDGGYVHLDRKILPVNVQ